MIGSSRSSARFPRRRAAVRASFEPLEGRTLLAVASIADASVTEGDSGAKTLSFIVTLSEPSRSAAKVYFRTLEGTAQAGSDYVATSGWVKIAAGRTQASVSVAIKGNKAFEPNETFAVSLSRPVGCTLGRSTATGTVLNDDPTPPTGSWTILVYMTGENLNADARADINEMEKALVGMPGSVRFAVSWDQPKARVGSAYATGGGTQAAWRTYGRSVLKADANMSRIASSFDLSLGERNTGDPATLVDFVKWGAAYAPADNYVLQLWGHGGGLDGSQFDSESGGDALTIPEIAAALAGPGMPSIDVVSYDNCLMAMAEVGAAIAPSVSGVFVASQELVNSTGQDYTSAFAALAVADPATVTATQVAAGMVASYGAQYAGDSWGCDTFSATATSGYAGLMAAIKAFVDAGASLAAGDRTTLLGIAEASTSYEVSSFRDLGGFMNGVSSAVSLPEPLRTAAQGVATALASTVTAKTADGRSSSGMSVYLPTWSDDPYLTTYRTDAAAFCTATGWDSFAKWLATGARAIYGYPVAAAETTPANRPSSRRVLLHADPLDRLRHQA